MDRLLKKLPLFLLLFTFVLAGCRPNQKDGFGIYLLTRDIPATELSKIDIDDLSLQSQPLIGSDDILSYHKADHTLELTSSAYARLRQIFSTPIRVNGIPFVVCVGDERIYTGGFWTPLSSLSYDGVVILQPWDEKETTIQIALGYPGGDFFQGDDPRADPRIMKVLERDKKLK
jgi:hypothetical protein